MRSHSRHEHKRVLATALTLSLAIPAISATSAMATTLEEADPATPPGTFREINLGTDRTDQNFFYRIPALAHLGNGVVLAAWDDRPGSAGDAPNPNSIIQRKSTDNGVTWALSPPSPPALPESRTKENTATPTPAKLLMTKAERPLLSSFIQKTRASAAARGATMTPTGRCSAQLWSSPPTMERLGASLA